MSASPGLGAFTNVVTLVLRQGDVPTTNGVNVVGASAYAGAVDTYVWREAPNTTCEGAEVLHWGGAQWVGFPSNASRTFMRFDNFTNCLPASARVVNARLYLVSAGDGLGGSGGDVYYRTASWTTGITWNTAGTCAQNAARIGSVTMNAWAPWPSNAVHYLDLTALAQAWQAGFVTNFGLLIDCNEDGEAHSERIVFSSDCSVVSNRPRLVMDCVVQNTVRVPSWGRTMANQAIVVTNGAGIIEDTYLAPDHSNYAAAASVDLRTYNNVNTPRRALLRIRAADPAVVRLAKSTDAVTPGVPRLKHARLQANVDALQEYLGLWQCSQNWVATNATDLSSDGGNSWAQAWTNTGISNVSADLGSSSGDNPLLAGTVGWDITSTVQSYVDGSNNFGFVIGQASGGAYYNDLALTEYGTPFMRPTLVLETWTPVVIEPGAIIQAR